MTKTLNSQLSQHEAPTTRSRTRIRTWLVALLGFGAADLLVLNLWAIPNLITKSTTTDMRAAQSGEPPRVPDLQPLAAVVAPAAPDEAAAAQPSEPQAALDQAQAAQPSAAPEEPAAAPANPEAAQQQAQAAKAEPEAPAPAEAEAQAIPAQQEDAVRAEAPPVVAPPLPAEAYAPPEPGTPTPFALRAAQRAVRVALQDRAAAGGTGPFDQLSSEAEPITQVYFSMGNYTLGPNGKLVLERMLAQLSEDERPILIVGSADPSGSEQVNEKLSDARAQSVAEWLLAHAIDASRIQTRAIGHEGAVGSMLDRRVDIWLGGSR